MPPNRNVSLSEEVFCDPSFFFWKIRLVNGYVGLGMAGQKLRVRFEIRLVEIWISSSLDRIT